MLDLSKLKQIYARNENLIEYMRNQSKTERNTAEQIMISYEFQAGTYAEFYHQAPEERIQAAKWIAEIICSKGISGSVLEAGVGEATTLVPLLNVLDSDGKRWFKSAYGFDISWSGIRAAQKFVQAQKQDQIHFFTGDLQNIPVQDNTFDLEPIRKKWEVI